MTQPVHIAFDGERPDVKDGDPIECRTTYGTWIRMTAYSSPRYDEATAVRGRCWLTVAVGPWADTPWVNWPAEDVRPIAPTTTGDPQ